MINTRPKLKELDTNIKAALQADPKLLEFYLNLSEEQKANSYISLDQGKLSPEAIIDIVRFMKGVEDGTLKGIKLELDGARNRDELKNQIDRMVRVDN